MTTFKKTILLALSAIAFCATIAFANTANFSTSAQAKVRHHRRYRSRVGGSEKAAKERIARGESGGRYEARGAGVYGRYQLSESWLHGDHSRRNQERAADHYVHSHYGSWGNAYRHWQRTRSY